MGFNENYIFVGLNRLKETKLLRLIKESDRINPVTKIFLASLVFLFVGLALNFGLLFFVALFIFFIYVFAIGIWIKQKMG